MGGGKCCLALGRDAGVVGAGACAWWDGMGVDLIMLGEGGNRV